MLVLCYNNLNMKKIHIIPVIIISIITILLNFYTVKASEEVFFHISDTHVADDSNHITQNSNLSKWVNATNDSGIQFSVNTGDLADYTNQMSDLNIYMNSIKSLINPHIFISGNHDYQGPVKYNFTSQGFNEYPVSIYGDYLFAGSPSAGNVSVDWNKLEQNLKLGMGEKRIILMQHVPFFAPSTLSCNGGACTAPKWILSADNSTKFKELIKKYDIGTVLSGHLHTPYVMKDKELYFDQINASSLLANRQNIIVEHLSNLWVQDGKYYDQSMVIVSPTKYDSQTGLGMILDQEPIALKYFGKTDITQVQYKIGSSGKYYDLTESSGFWSTDFDWAKYKGLSLYTLYVRTLSNNTVIREISTQFRVSSSYINKEPTININNQDILKEILDGTQNLVMNFNDDNYDVNLVELFIDGIRKQYWSYKKAKTGTVSYIWNTVNETDGKHVFRYKLTDQFGRKTYSNIFTVFVRKQDPTVTPSVVPPTPILTVTPTATPSPDICENIPVTTTIIQNGVGNYSEAIDSYFFTVGVTPSANKPEDNQPWSAPVIKTSGYYPKYKSLIKFGLTSIPKNSIIQKAVLNFTLSSWDGQSEKPVQYFARLNKSFDQQVSWNNASSQETWTIPGALGEGTDYLAPVKSKTINWGTNTIDITDFVQIWVKEPDLNSGVLIWETDGHMAVHYSSDYSTDLTKRPKLDLTYIPCN